MFGRIHKDLPTWDKTWKWKLSIGNWYSLVLDVSRLRRPYLFRTVPLGHSPCPAVPLVVRTAEAVGHVSDPGDDPFPVPVLVAEDVDSRIQPRHLDTDNNDHV